MREKNPLCLTDLLSPNVNAGQAITPPAQQQKDVVNGPNIVNELLNREKGGNSSACVCPNWRGIYQTCTLYMFMWPVFIYPGMMMHGATQKLLNDPVTWKGCTSPSPFQRLAARSAMVDGITCIAFKRKKEENICKPCLSFLNATDKDVPLACGSSWQTLRLATRMRRTRKRNEEEKRGGEGESWHDLPLYSIFLFLKRLLLDCWWSLLSQYLYTWHGHRSQPISHSV